jgi:8-oxo-dGTP pyrophosphatase MutT (NUDIX family)
MSSFEDSLRQAVSLDLPYTQRPGNPGAKPAAVLALFGGAETNRISLLLTRRTETLDHHRGQMAFPGGTRDLLAEGREDAVTAALRETEEEVGIPREQIRVVGELPALIVPSGFEIHPVVGVLKQPIADVKLNPNAHEIAEAMWIDLETLQSPDTYRLENIEVGPVKFMNHVFQVGPHRIWGATGAMIRNLLDRLASPLFSPSTRSWGR